MKLTSSILGYLRTVYDGHLPGGIRIIDDGHEGQILAPAFPGWCGYTFHLWIPPRVGDTVAPVASVRLRFRTEKAVASVRPRFRTEKAAASSPDTWHPSRINDLVEIACKGLLEMAAGRQPEPQEDIQIGLMPLPGHPALEPITSESEP